MDVSVSALGAIVALVVAIGLILRKVPPVYGIFSLPDEFDHLPPLLFRLFFLAGAVGSLLLC